jgi:hypothetical protein
MLPNRVAHLVVKVDGKRPVSVVVMAVHTMVAELAIDEVKRVCAQIERMEDHLHDGIEQEDR